jgi:hypothetical protein
VPSEESHGEVAGHGKKTVTNASYCYQARAGRAEPGKFDFAQPPAGSGKAPLVGALNRI